MNAVLTKPAVDVGIVVADPEPMLAFYRDLIGFEDLGAVTVPGFGQFYRLRCGQGTVKLLLSEQPPATTDHSRGFSATGGLANFSIWVSNLREFVDTASAIGVKITVPVTELGPLRMAMLEDPEGNAVAPRSEDRLTPNGAFCADACRHLVGNRRTVDGRRCRGRRPEGPRSPRLTGRLGTVPQRSPSRYRRPPLAPTGDRRS